MQAGQASPLMVNVLAGKFGGVPFKYFGEWTDSIANGALPFAKPPRPAGRRAQYRDHGMGLEQPR